MELNKSLFQALLIFSANSNRDGQEIPRGIHIHSTCLHRNNYITSYACFSFRLFSFLLYHQTALETERISSIMLSLLFSHLFVCLFVFPTGMTSMLLQGSCGHIASVSLSFHLIESTETRKSKQRCT